MRDNKQELGRQLRSWDPASRLPGPDPVSVAVMREALSQAARRRPRFAPLIAVAALTAASLVALFFLTPGAPVVAPTASADPVNMQFTASNGVQIHWSVYPEPPTESRRIQQSEERQ